MVGQYGKTQAWVLLGSQIDRGYHLPTLTTSSPQKKKTYRSIELKGMHNNALLF